MMAMIWTWEQGWDWIKKVAVQVAFQIGSIVVWVGYEIRTFGENMVAAFILQVEPMFPSVNWESVRSTYFRREDALEGANFARY